MGGNKTLMGTGGLIGDVDLKARNPVGMTVPDEVGNEFMYVQGVANCVQGDWLVILGDGTTIRALSSPLVGGRVGVAMAAIPANQFGWVQTNGRVDATPQGNGLTVASIATDAAGDKKGLFLSATAGRASTTSGAGLTILGAWAFGNPGTPTANMGACVLNEPFAPGYALV